MTRSAGSRIEHQVRARAVPAEMQAVVIDEFGPPPVLKLRTVPVPEPGPGEVVIAVQAAGVGIWDARIRDGSWAEAGSRFPLILGTDGAGVVIARGNRVRRFQVGDRVWAYRYNNPKGGFYAEHVAVDAGHAGKLPSGLTMLEGGAAAVTGLTALQGIHDQLAVRQGELVMIFGASGAVGTLAVQFAAALEGARVLAIASGDDTRMLLEKLGAETVIDGRQGDALERIDRAAPNGLDSILALAGSPVLEAAIDRVRSGGRVAYPTGIEPEPQRRSRLRMVAYDAEATPAAFARLHRAVDTVGLEVPIAATFPLGQAAQAHDRLERGHVVGRIALEIR